MTCSIALMPDVIFQHSKTNSFPRPVTRGFGRKYSGWSRFTAWRKKAKKYHHQSAFNPRYRVSAAPLQLTSTFELLLKYCLFSSHSLYFIVMWSFWFLLSWIRKFDYPCSEGRGAHPSTPRSIIPSLIVCLSTGPVNKLSFQM